MGRTLVVTAVSLGLIACSGSDGGGSYGYRGDDRQPFPALPASSAETVVLNGRISFWMYQGGAGCYGHLTDGRTEVQLWVDMDTCGDVQYERNDEASVAITFDADHQQGLGRTYTIRSFL